MSATFSLYASETMTAPTVKVQRRIRVGRTHVTYTNETASNRTPSRRLFLLPGLLGCEVAYAASQHHLAQTTDSEVVTLTHDRSFLQAFHASPQRSMDSYTVMQDSRQVFGDLPIFIIGHSMGGADAAHAALHAAKHHKRLNIQGIGFESSVGLNGRIPDLRGGLGFLHEELLDTTHIGNDQRHVMLATIGEYFKNPVLAAAEGVLASTANIRGDVAEIRAYGIPTTEWFGTSDWLIRPPKNRPQSVIRQGIGHLAVCLDPDVAYTDAEEVFALDRVTVPQTNMYLS